MTTSVHLTPEIQHRLDQLASQTGLSKQSLLRQIIEHGIEDVEDYYLATEVLERVKSGEEPVYSSAEIRVELGLED